MTVVKKSVSTPKVVEGMAGLAHPVVQWRAFSPSSRARQPREIVPSTPPEKCTRAPASGGGAKIIYCVDL